MRCLQAIIVVCAVMALLFGSLSADTVAVWMAALAAFAKLRELQVSGSALPRTGQWSAIIGCIMIALLWRSSEISGHILLPQECAHHVHELHHKAMQSCHVVALLARLSTAAVIVMLLLPVVVLWRGMGCNTKNDA